ncbi:MAG: hypothetical protein OK457_11260 [Thaumarchaeota archaeon]|nr:hypothetical protein [Nitrososphaerota archaeon]
MDDSSIFVTKEVLPSLDGYGLTESVIGDPKGSLRQYRNSRGLHVREYEDRYEIHVDLVDPQEDPLGHLVFDSPETLSAIAASSLLARKAKSSSSPTVRLFGNPFGFLFLFLFFNNIFGKIKRLIFS